MSVCALLPAATVAQLTGVHVKTAKAGAPAPKGVPLTLSSCDYEGNLNQLDITYTKSQFSESQFAQDYDTNKQVISRTAMVSGIGDKAFTANFPSEWLEVYWDGALYEISGASTVSIDAAKRVVTTLHDKL